MSVLRVCAIVLFAYAITIDNGLAQTQYRITLEEARRLAYEALPGDIKKLPGLTLLADEGDKQPPKCSYFDVLWKNPNPDGSAHVGFWAVDTRTGEVWTPILCKRVTNGAVRKLQQEIRKRLGVTQAEYQEALKHSPCCSSEPPSKRAREKTFGIGD